MTPAMGRFEAISRSSCSARGTCSPSWQRDKLLRRATPNGFFYGGCKVLFHLAEGTFARVYRGIRKIKPVIESVAIKVLRRRFTTDASAVVRFQSGSRVWPQTDSPQHRPDLPITARQDKNYLHDHGVCGGFQPSRLPQDPRPVGSKPKEALPMMIGLSQRACKFSMDTGRDPPRHQGVEHPHREARGTAKLVDFGLAATRRLDEGFSAGARLTASAPSIIPR